MVPALEYVSVGCWRENIESPWIPSIEGQSLPYGINYLTGIPENRPDAITACAMATLRLGYEVFAIRQMGVCATSPDAHLYFRFEGSSTSCSEGKGGARDNSVYRFARQGMMTQQQGLVGSPDKA
ncbi:FTP domain-containing protein [Durusdinium trenchii]|uniref:FTP domain-containing protein n=1 Tax=Durusdinium trenchii TaxID=1381693 RepID=A0ABP0KMX0_9DINO